MLFSFLTYIFESNKKHDKKSPLETRNIEKRTREHVVINSYVDICSFALLAERYTEKKKSVLGFEQLSCYNFFFFIQLLKKTSSIPMLYRAWTMSPSWRSPSG